MRRVVLEPPYAGQVERNVLYVRACLRDCLERGEAPIASHLLHAQEGVLDDADPAQRERGIEAGLAWMPYANAVVCYVDLGTSSGMEAALQMAKRIGVPVEMRRLPDFPGFVAGVIHRALARELEGRFVGEPATQEAVDSARASINRTVATVFPSLADPDHHLDYSVRGTRDELRIELIGRTPLGEAVVRRIDDIARRMHG